jgi:hypothetical protein
MESLPELARSRFFATLRMTNRKAKGSANASARLLDRALR